MAERTLFWNESCCWGKSIVQAELGRYTVSTGETAMRAFNRLPGKLPGRRGRVSWFVWFWLASNFVVKNPVWMITLGIMGALMMPVVAGATLYLRHAHVDARIAPGAVASGSLWVCSVLMVALGGYASGRLLWG